MVLVCLGTFTGYFLKVSKLQKSNDWWGAIYICCLPPAPKAVEQNSAIFEGTFRGGADETLPPAPKGEKENSAIF